FLQGSLGPRDNNLVNGDVGNSIGCKLNIYNNYDVLYPVPFIKDSSKMRIVAFLYIGNNNTTYNLNGGVSPQPKQETT
ncbi:hypothetical protein, partial [Francisella tularensis]|uniref:hypothetical protein n=1 Tax=Francisella tularensis TaxID=263 RepID=UPI0023819DBF